MTMYQRDFDAEQFETHLHQQESRRWEATLQAGGDDDWTPDEIAASPLPALPDGSLEDSAVAIRDQARFYATLATILPPDRVEAIKQEFGAK